MFCPRCGKQLPFDDAKFCPNCGGKIIGSKGGKAPGSRRKKFKAVAIIVFIIIAIIAGAFVYAKYLQGAPGSSGGSGINPTNTITPMPTARSFVILPTQTEVPLPTTGVWVRVDYPGSWRGSYGTTGAPVTIIDSGVRQYKVESPNGTIQASIRKDDGTNHELIVEIYKNGVVIKQGTTNAPYGSVDISVFLTDAIVSRTVTSPTTTVTQKK
jgi:predicted nucleic acid-binding Zn ribbon protein